MTIPVLRTLDRTAANYRSQVNALFTGEINEWSAALNQQAAALMAMWGGTAFALAYTVSSETDDEDPTDGFLRFSDFAAQTSATALRLALVDATEADRTTRIDGFAASTSSVKGQFALIDRNDPTKRLLGNFAAVAGSGYRNLTISDLEGFNSEGASAAPFAGGDDVVLLYTRTGDKGDTGPAAAGPITESALTMSTARLVGRTTASTGAPEEIAVGDRLALVAGVLSSTAGPTLGTPVVTTSGTSVDYTGLPAGTRRITVTFSDVSIDAANSIIVQLGGSGGIENSGYVGGNVVNGAAAAWGGSGVVLHSSSGGATRVYNGVITLTLQDASANTWLAVCTSMRSDTTEGSFGTGYKSLTGTLDRLRITTASGSANFDAGKVNIAYEI